MDSPASPWHRVFSLAGQLGIGAPLGLVGMTAELTPAPWFSAYAGLGLSSSGLQEAAMGRLRIPTENVSFALGGGVSTGPYEWSPLIEYDSHTVYRWDRAWWGNIEFSLEHREENGITFRGFIGFAILVNQADGQCGIEESGANTTCSTAGTNTWLPYLGMSVGYAFGGAH
jgi:hypothetical protein